MALIKPQGSLTWTPSPSEDTVSYKLYQSIRPTLDGSGFDYANTPSVDVGLVTTINLPVPGLPAIPSGTEVRFAVTAVDAAGNESDFAPSEAVLIDVEAPNPPTDVVFSRF